MARFVSAALDPQRHDTHAFDSGEPALDDWLRQHAAGAEARRVSRTFVWAGPGDPVVGFYSLSGHVLVRGERPKRLGHGSPSEIPVVLLGRLALDRTVHGQGLGGALLADALSRAVASTRLVAARFVVVDALHAEAAAFYEHHGFGPIPGTLRLVQKVSEIAAALGPG